MKSLRVNNPWNQGKLSLNQLEFETPMLARFIYNPGKHFSFPVMRCACGEPLDTYDYCVKCQKHIFDH